MIPVVATGTLRRGSMPSTTSVPQQLLIALDQPPADILEDVKLFELLQAFPVSSCCDLEVRQLLQTRLHNCLDTIARLIAKHGSLHEILTAVDRSELDQQLALAQKKSAHAARLQQALRKVAEFQNGVFVVTLKSTDHEKVGGILKLTVSDIPLGMHEQLVSEEGLSLDADVRLAKTLLESKRSSSHPSVPGLHCKRNTTVSQPLLDADAGLTATLLERRQSSSHTSVPGLHAPISSNRRGSPARVRRRRTLVGPSRRSPSQMPAVRQESVSGHQKEIAVSEPLSRPRQRVSSFSL